MPHLYGKHYTRAEFLAHVGKVEQAASITAFDFTQGPERGTRGLAVRNAAGLEFTVHPDRCLDIGAASFGGKPLAWTSATGFPARDFYEPEERGWLRTFGGGLVATCGLTNVGPPTNDDWGKTGQHGRIGHLPAFDVACGGQWSGDDYALTMTGQVRETRVFGENLLLRRTITVPLDSPRLFLTDTVTNEGDAPVPLMLLYHCNLGFPLLSAAAFVDGDFSQIVPRDADAEDGKERALLFDPPTAQYREKVYWLHANPQPSGRASVSLVNPDTDLCLSLAYDTAALPCLAQWKQMGQGAYTVGLEPGNVYPLGRAHYLNQGTLPMLAPGETRTFALDFAAGPASSVPASDRVK